MDKGNSPQLTDDNTILYGHNITSDRSMFNILTRYKDTEFAAEHPVIQLNTLYNRRQYAVARCTSFPLDRSMGSCLTISAI